MDDLVSKCFVKPTDYIPPKPEVKNPSMLTTANFDPATYAIKPVKFEVFTAMLREHNLSCTNYKNDSTCTICRDGPVNDQLLILATKDCADFIANSEGGTPSTQKGLDAIKLANEYQKLQNIRAHCANKQINYRAHLSSMATSRKYAYKKRDEMKVGEVFVTRDFVNRL